MRTPTEVLLETKPDYSRLKVFGSACWPNLRPYNSQKLAFRSTQCVFIGYSPMHKGYKCLEPKTGRVYISRDVIFDEHVFPFEGLHDNAGAKLRQEIMLLHPSLLSESHAFLEGHGLPRSEDEVQQEISEDENNVRNNSLGTPSQDDRDSLPIGVQDNSVADIDIEAVGALSLIRESGEVATGHRSCSPSKSQPVETEQVLHGIDPISTAESRTIDVPLAPVENIKTRSKSGIFKQKVYTDGTIRYSLSVTTGEPRTLDEALIDKNWRKAMDLEFQALQNNNTWHLVTPVDGKKCY
jgi:hypothetical protein